MPEEEPAYASDNATGAARSRAEQQSYWNMMTGVELGRGKIDWLYYKDSYDMDHIGYGRFVAIHPGKPTSILEIILHKLPLGSGERAEYDPDTGQLAEAGAVYIVLGKAAVQFGYMSAVNVAEAQFEWYNKNVKGGNKNASQDDQPDAPDAG